MKTIKVKANKNYKVIIGEKVCEIVGEKIKALSPKTEKVMIVTETTVFSLYANKVASSLRKSGYEVYLHVFKAGEENKTLNTVEKIIGDLSAYKFTRTDILIALGGGVTGDITGFASSIYLRGVNYIQMPTTLLSAVDSSVGGKTGVDLPSGKNLIGAFWQPLVVVCDTDFIKSLPQKIYAQGLAEVIKYGIICDKAFFYGIRNNELSLEEIICRSVEIKAEIVMDDEFDNGKRQLLNLGHTFGHAIELLSNFELSHGEAISIGTVIACEFSNKINFGKVDIDLVKEVLVNNGLPVATNFTHSEIFETLLTDKKRRGNQISLILPVEIGDSRIYKIEIEKFKELFI